MGFIFGMITSRLDTTWRLYVDADILCRQGGGVTAAFVASFPHLVEKVVLIAASGVPDRVVCTLSRRRRRDWSLTLCCSIAQLCSTGAFSRLVALVQG